MIGMDVARADFVDTLTFVGLRTSYYTFQPGSGCQTKEDPVNILARGTHGDVNNVTAHLVDHTGWTYNQSGDSAISRYGYCRLEDHQRISASSAPRFHTRLWSEPYQYTPGTLYYSVIAAHEDVDCGGGDTVPYEGYNRARGAVYGAFRDGGHVVDTTYQGNTDYLPQKCAPNGRQSDGIVAILYVNSYEPCCRP